MNSAITILAAATALSVCTAGSGQNGSVVGAIDPFIGAVETMKHSVAPVTCVVVNGGESKLLARRGTAFFVSTAGEFITAAHVLLDMQKIDPACPVTAVILPRNRTWDPSALNEDVEWFAFKIGTCLIDRDLDVAKCRTTDDLSSQTLDFKIVPVKFHWDVPPDAAQVAFTGFPLNARDPMTLRANVAAYRPVWRNEKLVPEVLLDRGAWPGSSGSPIFLSDGRVIGILIAARTEEGTAMTNLRPVSAVRDLLTAAYGSGKK